MSYSTMSEPLFRLTSLLPTTLLTLLRKIPRVVMNAFVIAAILSLITVPLSQSAIAGPVTPPPDTGYPTAKLYRPVVITGKDSSRIGVPTTWHDCKYNALPSLVYLTINYYNEPVHDSYCRYDKWQSKS